MKTVRVKGLQAGMKGSSDFVLQFRFLFAMTKTKYIRLKEDSIIIDVCSIKLVKVCN